MSESPTNEPGVELERRDSRGVTLAPLDDPGSFVAQYTAVANTLADVLKERKLTSMISGNEHVRVEGWTLLGTMLGVFPICTWTRPVMAGDEQVGWEARVEARTKEGALVGAAEAECLRAESKWRGRDDYALRSMAQTRATSKALRQPLGFVVSLAGFNPTPAEEMDFAGAGDDAAASGKQLSYLRGLLKQHGYDTGMIDGKSVERLTRSEASSYIEQLKGASDPSAPISSDAEVVLEADSYVDEEDIPF